MHPLVVSVRTLDRTEIADGYVQTYRVSDRIPLGPLRLRTSYVARLQVPMAGDVSTEAPAVPSSAAARQRCLRTDTTGTRIVERVQIEAPWPLASVTIRKAVEAHTEMLAGIRRAFDDAAN